jgi:hypothetical protein
MTAAPGRDRPVHIPFGWHSQAASANSDVAPAPLEHKTGPLPFWLIKPAGWRGRLAETGVQTGPDLLRRVRTATPLGSRDRHPGGGDTDEGRHAEHLVPAHLPTLQPWLDFRSTSTRPST